MADRVGQQLGHYRLLRFLGQGAFADVYLGEHQYLERLAAIKVLHLRMEQDTQEQFRLEARTIANLQHPHIVQVHDFGLDEQTPYLVMEYTSGGTLLSQHPKGTRLCLEQIVTYVKQIASALEYAHQQRVIHRDVKPANLLLNARGEVVLSDFGLAVVQRTLESLSTQGPAGTPLYMAPEQIRGKPCPASDQYALGIMVYQWLCGEPPFQGQRYAVLGQHLHERPPSLCERLPHLPLAVEDAVFGALAKEPGQRFATVEDFALALEEACQVTQPLSLRWGAAQQSTEQDTPPAPAMPPVLLTPPRPTNGHHLLPPRPTLHQQTDSKVGKPTLAQSNRQRFLKRVRAFWIEGVLEHSLHGAALIALGLQEQRDALANPWHLVVQHSDTLPRPFPVGTCITEVYDAANGELLILGAPGAGKTTLLLELARHLLDRAEQDEQQPMPIVFPLSSWATRQQPLGEWMIEELIGKYQVPQQLARTWVETDQILPLLDGLDEVAAENRTTCIEAINTYQQQHAFLPLVVASRRADYLAQTARVKLTSAVTIQPLTQQQVDEYLAQAGEPLWALRVALHQDTALRELAETPLMLSILTLTYHGMPVEELLRGGIAPTRQQVFERYTERMLSRRGTIPSYSPQQTKGWLSWLARQMQRQGQTVFYLERLQPDWLPSSRLLRAYHRWAIRLPGVLIGILLCLAITGLGSGTVIMTTLLGGLLGGLLSGGGAAQQPAPHGRKMRRISWQQILRWLLLGSFIGLGIGLSNGLSSHGPLGGLSSGVIYGLGSLLLQVLPVKSNSTQPPSQTSPPIGRTKWQHLIRNTALRNGLLIGVVVGLSSGLSFGLSDRLTIGLSDRLILGLFTGLSLGLFYGFTGGLLSHLLVGRIVTVQLTERVILSWKSLRRSLWSSQNRRAALQVVALVGLIFGLIFGLSGRLVYGLSGGLAYGLSGGLSYWFLSGFFQGVSSETIEDQQRVVPNQGIQRSAKNGLLLGLVSAIIVGLSYVLTFGLTIGLIIVLSSMLSGGLS
ncbi:MAG TPA: protein kinase, partial [Ktedonobacteraceae bacterium]|nr:protein kinase [Ktedonobacteraceae bacterium]